MSFWAPFLASILAAAITTSGIYAVRHHRDWARKNSTYILCFAAGVLVAVTFLHLIPESLTLARYAPLYLLMGFLFPFFMNRLINVYLSEVDVETPYHIGIVPMVGIGFHSFVDGIIYPVTFGVSPFTGVMAAVGMVLHEFPEGIVTYVLLTRGGFSERKSLILAFLAAAITTPLGTGISYPLIKQAEPALLGILLSLSAGVLVYVGASHLLPQAEREEHKYTTPALLAGIMAAAVTVFLRR